MANINASLSICHSLQQHFIQNKVVDPVCVKLQIFNVILDSFYTYFDPHRGSP